MASVYRFKLNHPSFKWTTLARSPEEAAVQFKANAATLLKTSVSKSLRTKAAKLLRLKVLPIESY